MLAWMKLPGVRHRIYGGTLHDMDADSFATVGPATRDPVLPVTLPGVGKQARPG
jgi:hypothetical protein